MSMVGVYYTLVKNNIRDMSTVPDDLKAEVQAMLDNGGPQLPGQTQENKDAK